jgi:hypothetical protein
MKTSMRVPMVLLDLSGWETFGNAPSLEATNIDIETMARLLVYPSIPFSGSWEMVTVEQIYSGPVQALYPKPQKIADGLLISVFLKEHGATRTASERGTHLHG